MALPRRRQSELHCAGLGFATAPRMRWSWILLAALVACSNRAKPGTRGPSTHGTPSDAAVPADAATVVFNPDLGPPPPPPPPPDFGDPAAPWPIADRTVCGSPQGLGRGPIGT